MTAKPTKCEWVASQLLYLGHVIVKGYVSVPEARVSAIKNFKHPVTKRDMHAFLGMVGYYRRFIPQFSVQAQPLTAATIKCAPLCISWSVEMKDAFSYLINALGSQSMLYLP